MAHPARGNQRPSPLGYLLKADAKRYVIAAVEALAEHKPFADEMIKRLQSDLWGLVERRLAELQAKVDVALDAKPRASSAFKFANERQEHDEPVELPNPLPPRRTIN